MPKTAALKSRKIKTVNFTPHIHEVAKKVCPNHRMSSRAEQIIEDLMIKACRDMADYAGERTGLEKKKIISQNDMSHAGDIVLGSPVLHLNV